MHFYQTQWLPRPILPSLSPRNANNLCKVCPACYQVRRECKSDSCQIFWILPYWPTINLSSERNDMIHSQHLEAFYNIIIIQFSKIKRHCRFSKMPKLNIKHKLSTIYNVRFHHFKIMMSFKTGRYEDMFVCILYDNT